MNHNRTGLNENKISPSPPKQAGNNPVKPWASGLEKFLEKHSRAVILLLCLVAGLRVAIFSAAFPLFNNVDEPAHFDLVAKYARGHIPKKIEKFDKDVSMAIVLYGSPEYLNRPETYLGGEFPPPPLWTIPDRLADASFREFIQECMEQVAESFNHESTQPPLYYALAAAWYRLGARLGMGLGYGAYWIRFLNVFIYGLLVWMSFVFIKGLYPGNPFLQFGVPFLLAFFPQDIFYGISSDVLSPLLFAAAFYCLLKVVLEEPKNYGFYLATGLLVAAALLVKISNLAILAVLVIILVMRIIKIARGGRLGREFPKILVLALAAALPVFLWSARNYLVLHDPWGSMEKIQHLGWTVKPWNEIGGHPIFSLPGLATFFQELTASFWRGEIVWHLQRLAYRSFDLFYTLSSLLFISMAALTLGRGQDVDKSRRCINFLSLLSLVLSIAFLAILSIKFDFYECFYPSRAYPYLTSGRLILGILVPFLVLYLGGLDYVLSRLKLSRCRWAVVFLMVGIITISEIALSYQVFKSPYNLFHML